MVNVNADPRSRSEMLAVRYNMGGETGPASTMAAHSCVA
jgi:hypothetical protein